MTQEQIEQIAKYATDSYFVNMDSNQKLAMSQEDYLKAYTNAYLKAVETVTATLQQNKEKENLSNQFH